MGKKEIVAMILAGGQGSRLGVLTKDIAKPAIIMKKGDAFVKRKR